MTTKNGIYRIKNEDDNYDVIHFETSASQVIDNPDRRFTSDAEKSTWNNKASASGSLNVDFNTKNLYINGSITPNTNGTLNIGSDSRKINILTANATKVDAVHIGSTSSALGLENGSITVKGALNQDVNVKSTGTGNVGINTASKLNLIANGSNSSVSVQATKSIDATASSINLNGTVAAKSTAITGTLSVSGDATLKGETNVESNYLTINSKESGAGVTAKIAGVKVKRGTAADYLLVFDETDDKIKAGTATDLQSLATETWVKANSNAYVHPSTHPASMITESTTRKFVSEDEKNAWNAKEEKGHIHIGDDISDATSSNSAGMIVKRNGNGDFSARTITASLSGNASTATKLATKRTINGVDFDGTANITITAAPTAHNHTWDSVQNKPTSFPPSAHNHDNAYLKLAGGTVTGALTVLGTAASESFKVRGIQGVTSGGEENDALYLNYNNTNPVYINGTNKVYHQGNKPTASEIGAASSSHKHSSADITTMTSYAKASAVSAIATTDTLNVAVGKLEKALDGKSSTSHAHAWDAITNKPTTFPPATHNHDSVYLKLSGGTVTGNIVIGAALQDSRLTTNKQLINVGSGNIYVGNPSTVLRLESSANPTTTVGSNTYTLYHSGHKQAVTWGDVSGKPTSFTPSDHNHNTSQVTALTSYEKATLTSALTATDTLNAALGKLERALDDKSNNHTHPYRSNTWVPAWGDVTGKPAFATVATSGSYNDLANKPTIHTINDSSTTSTTNTWSAKKINDSLGGKSATGHKHVVSDITDAGTAATKNVGTASGNVPVLDSKGKLAVSTLPSIAINETFTATTQDDALTKTVEVGDIMIVGSGTATSTYICVDATKTTFDEKFKPLMSAADSVTKGEFNDALAGKVDKVNGKQLSANDFTTTLKNKLDGIAANANNYVHPSKHAPAEISTDSNNRFVTDAEKTTWNGKAAGNHNHDTVYAPIEHSASHDTRYFRRDSANGVDVRLSSADGRGLRFWDSDSYKIYMSSTANSTLGGALETTGDYNMYFRMTGTSRGFVFKNDTTNVAQINGAGNLYTLGEMYVGSAKNRVYHAGNKPTPADIGAAPTHSHPYLSTGGGNVTGNVTMPTDDTGITLNGGARIYKKQGSGLTLVPHLDATGVTITNAANTSTLFNVNSGTITYKGNKVYHSGDKPTASDIGAAATSHGNHVPATQSANSRIFLRNDNTWQTIPSGTVDQTGIVQLYNGINSTSTTLAATANAVKLAYDLANGKANSSHNHTSLTGITSLAFATDSSDSASIKTTVDSSNTYFDFMLSDDPSQNDQWRWRFTPSGATTFSAMVLNPVSSTSANLTVAGEVYAGSNRVYHAGYKPSASDIGAAAASHGNHVPATQTADARKFLRNDNTWQALPGATTGATGIVQLNDATNSTSTTQAATANAVKKAYDLANGKANSSHSHSNIASRGAIAMETSTNRPALSGISMQEAYSNSYPTSYGNVMTMKGAGDGQLLIGWSGTSGGHAPAYIRSKRDTADAAWSGWAQIYTSANKPTLTDLGITTLTRGSYLTGGNYNGTSAQTWGVDATESATASKVVARDSAADINCRLLRSNYANQTNISGAIAFRVNNSTDNYVRYCSDTGAIRTFLSVYAKSETYSRSEMDGRYRQKTDVVFTNAMIEITTPAT